MKRLMFIFSCLWVFTLPVLYSQVQDTTFSNKYKRDISADRSMEDYQKSAEYFLEVLKKDTNDLEAYYKLGMSYYKLSDYKGAIATYDRLVEKDYCFNYALTNRAVCKFFLQDRDGACQDIIKALTCNYPDMSSTREDYELFCK
ncbi:MAG: tetratricopeptide repeat protein [Chlorobi bacterium]|nr:tetratricopeptide repeat protein [Chlorobiota bacterium]